jgi:hypothetical protein
VASAEGVSISPEARETAIADARAEISAIAA